VSLTKTIVRTAALAALILPLATPVFAGEAEVRYLQSLAGQYAGKGNISGEDGGPVNCRLTLKPSGAKINYTGRCTGGGGSQSFSGSIRFNDKTGRYESSSRGKTVAGRKSGRTLTFTLASNDSRGQGTSTMSFAPGSISVRFDIRQRNGERNAGTIPFRRG
jgi:hypothetical protein